MFRLCRLLFSASAGFFAYLCIMYVCMVDLHEVVPKTLELSHDGLGRSFVVDERRS